LPDPLSGKIQYVKLHIFDTQNAWIVLTVLAVMIIATSWIGLRTVKHKQLRLYPKTLLALIVGGGTTLILVTQGILNLTPWYLETYIIPPAGMIFTHAMNSVSFAADRLEKPCGHERGHALGKVVLTAAPLSQAITPLHSLC